MQYLSFKVDAGEILPGTKNNILVSFDKEVAFMPKQKIFVLNPNFKMRFVGVGEIENSGD